MIRKGFYLIAGLTAAQLCSSVAIPAQAADKMWTASACGAEPVPPSVEVSSVDKYNASVDKVSAYEKAARTYNSCVAKAAVKEETAISNEAREKIAHIHEGSSTVQKRIAGNFTKLTTALKAGGAKLQKAEH
ncbi:hypothetical protein [Acetobacter pasteurianus]|uniref:hypothetical protein n=1 Tax=Acetobacter pasteurianus TaxID=438 RepID=UPI0013631ADD|nr:hypothetical protein [Acetobacter pasteurianus]QHM92266.1 hypothetical protein FCN51_12300 [Acetobacter pasteurianus]